MKKMKKIKRIGAILLIFLLNINVFATAVSDNDGSAFITKAEFDALKSSFQAQIDTYNQNIDSKIDNAIASYLANIRISTIYENKLFYPVDNLTTTGTRFFTKEEDFQEQKTQMFNSVNIDFNLLGYNYYATLKPYIHSLNADPTSFLDYDGWCFFNQTLKNLDLGAGGASNEIVAPNMESFIYDDINKDVLNEWWKRDVLNISGQITFAGNSYGLRKSDLLWNLINNLLINKQLNTTISYSGVQANSGSYNGYFTSSGTRLPARNAAASTWKNYVPDSMTGPSATSISGYGYKSSLTAYTQETLGNSFLVTESKSNQDKNIYLYHHCDANVYVHGSTEQTMVQCTDFLPDSSRPFISKVAQIAVADAAAEAVVYGKNSGKSSSNLSVDSEQAHGVVLPKVKLKNNSTYTDDSTGWTNLNKFKNGLLPYTDASGTIQYPKFYGGLPLYIENATAKKITLDIQIANDDPSIPYTNVWIKNGEFLNVADTRTWATADKNKLKELAGDGCVWKDDFRMLSIPNNTKKTIEIKNVNPGDVLFLRFAQNGSFSAGELKYLGNCMTELQN